jgi:hypothetical protein
VIRRNQVELLCCAEKEMEVRPSNSHFGHSSLKSEARNPNPEARIRELAGRPAPDASVSAFGFRPSFGPRPSDFGLPPPRPSDFGIGSLANPQNENCWISPPFPSAIIPIIIGGEAQAVAAAAALRDLGVFIPAIRYPAVARGSARLRLTVTAAHTAADVARLLAALDTAGLPPA